MVFNSNTVGIMLTNPTKSAAGIRAVNAGLPWRAIRNARGVDANDKKISEESVMPERPVVTKNDVHFITNTKIGAMNKKYVHLIEHKCRYRLHQLTGEKFSLRIGA